MLDKDAIIKVADLVRVGDFYKQDHNIIYEAIIEAATTSDCDLIFMASHGRRGLKSLLLGSETNKVLTHSKIPVLVYR